MRERRIIVIHCTATPASMEVTIDQLRAWHTQAPPLGRGWSDVGYHVLIMRNGTAAQGRPLSRTPAAQKGFNAGSITIALAGGVTDGARTPVDNFTDRQLQALEHEIIWLRKEYDVLSIIGHRDLGAKKDCPCFNVSEWVYNTFIR